MLVRPNPTRDEDIPAAARFAITFRYSSVEKRRTDQASAAELLEDLFANLDEPDEVGVALGVGVAIKAETTHRASRGSQSRPPHQRLCQTATVATLEPSARFDERVDALEGLTRTHRQ